MTSNPRLAPSYGHSEAGDVASLSGGECFVPLHSRQCETQTGRGESEGWCGTSHLKKAEESRCERKLIRDLILVVKEMRSSKIAGEA